jgi:hypothetical protein
MNLALESSTESASKHQKAQGNSSHQQQCTPVIINNISVITALHVQLPKTRLIVILLFTLSNCNQ